jgi:hypothetical protein
MMRHLLAVVIVLSLVSSAQAQPTGNGTVSQGGRLVQFSGSSVCPLTPGPGLSACTLPLCKLGCDDQRLPVSYARTAAHPDDGAGAVSVAGSETRRITAPATRKGTTPQRFVSASVRQLNATEVVIRFSKRLRTGEVAWVSVLYRGSKLKFFFLSVEKHS